MRTEETEKHTHGDTPDIENEPAKRKKHSKASGKKSKFVQKVVKVIEIRSGDDAFTWVDELVEEVLPASVMRRIVNLLVGVYAFSGMHLLMSFTSSMFLTMEMAIAARYLSYLLSRYSSILKSLDLR